ncbi:nitrilase-related carbon-nitrogen hydrolase [Phycisphaerales bacterium AB-hyl4]|uniref:Nitrilase-related carbon-nitrogen hydrolase n=1 Tax=Natronomicrosphaera hydrolytica TaxID=3242702 RepID=A0ABV4UBD8_9BACT
MTIMRVAGAQVHNKVGDIEGNLRQMAEAMQWAEQHEADVLVVPELALTGYPLADLVLHEAFIDDADAALASSPFSPAHQPPMAYP